MGATKLDVIKDVSYKTRIPFRDATIVVDTVFKSIINRLRTSRKLEIRGFGTFYARVRRARTFRNPRTGETHQLPEATAPGIKFSPEVMRAISSTIKIKNPTVLKAMQKYMENAEGIAPMKIWSPQFRNGGDIPIEHTLYGKNESPNISWSGIPKESKSFVLICEDPDAPNGNWTHWVMYDIQAPVNGLRSALDRRLEFSSGAKQGINDFKRIGYDGPKPPSGTHRYFFKIYALDSFLNIKAGLSKSVVLSAMKQHKILAKGIMFGKFTTPEGSSHVK